ncbi:MAG: TonB-dependent receptor [Marinagarivorans sp.]
MIDEVMVVAQRSAPQHTADAGSVSAEDLQSLPLSRNGDLIEVVPGMMATQHSGSGKANQYFLRGFNLDHGTDFSQTIDLMPINMRSHAHGQGYSDLNFIVPELLQRLDYRKGPYFVDAGDFSGAGSAHFYSANLVENFVALERGQLGYERAVVGYSTEVGLAQLLIGGEYQTYGGDWANVSEDVNKNNLWIKYAEGTPIDGAEVSLMAYNNSWNAADQVPARAVDAQVIPADYALDPSDGGHSHRYSLAAQKRWAFAEHQFLLNAYAIEYGLDLWSNFTYFTKPLGDQRLQADHRKTYGADAIWTFADSLWGKPSANTLGINWQLDEVDQLGLYDTQQRRIVDVIRDDNVLESSLAIYGQSAVQLSDRLRAVSGIRFDRYHFGVIAKNAAVPATLDANSGAISAGILTGGQKILYSIGPKLAGYASVGRGFHSNDARGVLTRQDPSSGAPAVSADPLVPVWGYEAGVHWGEQDDVFNTSVALWTLNINSELLFVGDAGTTDNTQIGSTRRGVEWVNSLKLTPRLRWVLEYSASHAALDHARDGTRRIPGALRHTMVNELIFSPVHNWTVSLRSRYFSSYPLDGGAWAPASSLVNGRIGFVGEHWRINCDVLNVLNSRDHDVEYFYASQLMNEDSEVEDRHYHMFAPRSVRVSWRYAF